MVDGAAFLPRRRNSVYRASSLSWPRFGLASPRRRDNARLDARLGLLPLPPIFRGLDLLGGDLLGGDKGSCRRSGDARRSDDAPPPCRYAARQDVRGGERTALRYRQEYG